MISENDRNVLNSILSPLTPLGITLTDAETNNFDKNSTTNGDEDDIEIKEMEIKAVMEAEKGDLKSAQEILSKAISLSSKRASLYNNRAQVYRLQGKTTDALLDLDEAITLSNGGTGSSGCQALCQRAIIYESLKRQQDANRDWTTAARNGSELAKKKIIQTNPYAALCNQMLRVVMATLSNPSATNEKTDNGNKK